MVTFDRFPQHAPVMLERIGNCEVLEEIGSGGMATVYKAIQQPLGRVVAVKALKPTIAVDSQFAKRFEREAHFMASLQHENILHVHDFMKRDGSMFIVMEYVSGIDLFDLLEKRNPLPLDVAVIIALKVARALDYAHFRGLVHRDVKPANIMVSRQGEVKLMDFGIARDDTMRDLTETGTGLGTPSYMSPEQILGDKLDFRSDVFSLGIVLYQMLTGKKPFIEDDSHTVMQKIRLDRYTSEAAQSGRAAQAGTDFGALHGEDAGSSLWQYAGVDRRFGRVFGDDRLHQPQRAARDVSARSAGDRRGRGRRNPGGRGIAHTTQAQRRRQPAARHWSCDGRGLRLHCGERRHYSGCRAQLRGRDRRFAHWRRQRSCQSPWLSGSGGGSVGRSLHRWNAACSHSHRRASAGFGRQALRQGGASALLPRDARSLV